MAMTPAEFKKQSQITPEQFGDLSLLSDNFAKPLMQELESTWDFYTSRKARLKPKP